MIEINLLPGSGKKKKSSGGGAKFNLGASFASLAANVKDKYLASAFLFLALGGGAVGATYTMQTKQESDLTSALEVAVKDSEHYATVLRDKQRAEAKRDTVLRQLNIIKSIDEDRYIWPHVMDEVSRALPQYTWVTQVAFTGTPQGATNLVALPKLTAADSARLKAGKPLPRLNTDVPKDNITFTLRGQTVDIQALTRYMKELEASPFLGTVNLERSELTTAVGKEVLAFQLTLGYSRPDTLQIRRVPMSLTSGK